MPKGRFSAIPDRDFIHDYKLKGFRQLARDYGLSTTAIAQRRKRIERMYGPLNGPRPCPTTNHIVPTPQRRLYDCLNGFVVIGSDAHIWPGPMTTAQRAMIRLVKDLKPRVVIMNGDLLDFSSISRHDPLSWENRPPVVAELEAAQKFMQAVEDAAPSNAKFAWPCGNHDSRFEGRLSRVAPEYAKVTGVHLKDHFSPKWEPCYSAFINDKTVVKHRLSGGIGALRMNVLKTRRNTVTGHLHAQHVWPVTAYGETLYGVDAGMLGEPHTEAFSYTEDNPVDWRSGFVVLEFFNGRLLPPDPVTVWDLDHVIFRGEIIHVPQEAQPASRVGRGRDRGRSHRAAR